MVYPALEISEILKKQSISATVINARFIKPLDEELILDAVLKHLNIVTIEENAISGGFGSAVLEFLAGKGITHYKCLNLGLPDDFVTQGSTQILKEMLELTPEKMADKIVAHFSFKKNIAKKVAISIFGRKQ
jgi:1-deoxy-D-xylulose-5-phosphate synthase